MLGSTLSNDPLADKRFDFQFDNPPYGYEWSKDYDADTTEAAAHGHFLAPGRYVGAEEVEDAINSTFANQLCHSY